MPSKPNQDIFDRNQCFVKLYASGKTLAQIAAEYNVSNGTVHQALKLMGVVRRKVGRPGKTNLEDTTKQRWYAIKSNYGLTHEQWDAILIEQCGLCDLCGKPMVDSKSPVVDHDHQTDKVRGLLHHSCNVALPYIEDLIFKTQAEAYLERHRV